MKCTRCCTLMKVSPSVRMVKPDCDCCACVRHESHVSSAGRLPQFMKVELTICTASFCGDHTANADVEKADDDAPTKRESSTCGRCPTRPSEMDQSMPMFQLSTSWMLTICTSPSRLGAMPAVLRHERTVSMVDSAVSVLAPSTPSAAHGSLKPVSAG